MQNSKPNKSNKTKDFTELHKPDSFITYGWIKTLFNCNFKKTLLFYEFALLSYIE